MAENEASNEAPTGVIDTIGYAFALLNRRPYLIWIPVLVDLAVWSGLRIQLRLEENVESALSGIWQPVSEEGITEIEFVNAATWTIPNLLGQAQFTNVPAPVTLSTFSLDSVAALVFVAIAFAFSIFLLATWAVLMGRLVQESPAGELTIIQDAARSGVRFLGAVVSVVALTVFMSIPMVLIAGGLLLMNVDPIVLLTLALLLLSGWLGLFFSFTLPALVLADRRIGTALRSSYQFVLENFLAVLGFLLIVLLIRAATPHALSVFADSQWSVPFAIVVNAYVVTGMLAAVLLLFTNRSPETRASTMTSPVPTRG